MVDFSLKYECHVCGKKGAEHTFRNVQEEVVTCAQCIISRSKTIHGDHLTSRERYVLAELELLCEHASSVFNCEGLEAYKVAISMIHAYAENVPLHGGE